MQQVRSNVTCLSLFVPRGSWLQRQNGVCFTTYRVFVSIQQDVVQHTYMTQIGGWEGKHGKYSQRSSRNQ